MEITAKVRAPKGRRYEKWKYEQTRFEARERPFAIFLGDSAIIGPFCRRCGFSFHDHSEDVCPPPPPLRGRNPLEKRPDAVRVR